MCGPVPSLQALLFGRGRDGGNVNKPDVANDHLPSRLSAFQAPQPETLSLSSPSPATRTTLTGTSNRMASLAAHGSYSSFSSQRILTIPRAIEVCHAPPSLSVRASPPVPSRTSSGRFSRSPAIAPDSGAQAPLSTIEVESPIRLEAADPARLLIGQIDELSIDDLSKYLRVRFCL
jgi:hypothetical protein